MRPGSKLWATELSGRQRKARSSDQCFNVLIEHGGAQVVEYEEYLRPPPYSSDSTTEFDDTTVEDMLFHMDEEWVTRTKSKATCGSLKPSHIKEAFKEYKSTNMQSFLDVEFVELEEPTPFLAAVQHSANVFVQGSVKSSVSSSYTFPIARSNPIPIPGNKPQRSFTL